MLWPRNDEKVREHFKKDIKNLDLLYDYDAENPKTGAPEKWCYEMWFHSEDRIVYAIRGGPMAGRLNYQKADYQLYDIKNQKITTMLNFSKGHWEYPEKAHGDKRSPEDFQRWRDLAKIGVQTDRHILNDQATILETFHGAGDLQDIDLNAATL
ncbi:uncharacterized protein UHOD_05360 [Ustilago sp. UG-2017b]|nr:uncharacterized protein UHOD_05360 [Ustilago sp. UG-2017b]